MALDTEREKGAHLLRRFGLGASEAELDYYLKDGLTGAVDLLLDYDKVDEGRDVDIEEMKTGKNQRVTLPSVVIWWASRMLVTRRPLQEKLTLFWHNHFATSASKVQQPYLMFDQNQTLRKNALGNFRTMLLEVSKDPAMIYWLDNQTNVKGHANENFAREVMELFTMGVGNYTEKDVLEGARAFTGWSLRREGGPGKQGHAEYMFRPNLHDDGQKLYLGNSGNLDGEDVLNILCDRPRTSVFITHKLWEWFVYPNPDAATVERFAKLFRESGLDIKAVLRAIMTSSDFYSPKAERSVVKNPVDFCVTTLRQLGVGEVVGEALKNTSDDVAFVRRFGTVGAAVQAMKAMGMWLMYPPDVHGWDIGQNWITSATMVERIQWGDRVFGQGKVARYPIRYPSYSLFENDPTPSGLVTKLISIFDAPVKKDKFGILIDAAQKASGGTITPANANPSAAAVARLIFASPEFQFC